MTIQPRHKWSFVLALGKNKEYAECYNLAETEGGSDSQSASVERARFVSVYNRGFYTRQYSTLFNVVGT